MTKDTNPNTSQEPDKPSSREVAKKRARSIKDSNARANQVAALKSGKAARKARKPKQ